MDIRTFVKHQINGIKSLKRGKESAWIVLLDELRYMCIHEPWYTDLYKSALEEYENDK